MNRSYKWFVLIPALAVAACGDGAGVTGPNVAALALDQVALLSTETGTDRWVDGFATATAPGSGCGAKAGYKTIRAAVTAASSGDHVIICPGVYEGVSYGGSTKNNLTLRSTNPLDASVVAETIIEQLGTTGYAIRLGWVDGQVTGTIIDGLTIRNASHTGINIQNSSNNTVRNSRVLNSERGISLTGNSPSDNRIENTSVLGSALTGVSVGSGTNNTISGSTICGNAPDINIGATSTVIANSRWNTEATFTKFTNGGGNGPCVVESPDTEPPVITDVTVTPNPAPASTISYALTATATDNVSVTAASYTIDGGAPVEFAFDADASVSLSTTLGTQGIGSHQLCVTATDGANASTAVCTTLVVTDDQAPVVTDVTVTPNSAPASTVSYALTATATDNVSVTAASYTIDGGAPVEFAFDAGASVSLSTTLGTQGIGSHQLCVTATDGANASTAVCTTLVVTDDQAPVVTNVVASPAALGTAATLTATATDNSAVTAASYTIDGGASTAFSVTAGSSVSLIASITGLGVGVYEVCVTAKDAAGNTSAAECAQLAVYDPSAGFVTGGGWFNSPAGAFKANLNLTGRANFGFVSKYERGASIPTGNTNFQFQAGSLSFASTSYEWLVVNRGATNAQYKGVGTVTINGVATTGAGFMLWAQDGKPDLFRIMISAPNGDVIYDNKIGSEFGTAIGGGNIIVHTK